MASWVGDKPSQPMPNPKGFASLRLFTVERTVAEGGGPSTDFIPVEGMVYVSTMEVSSIIYPYFITRPASPNELTLEITLPTFENQSRAQLHGVSSQRTSGVSVRPYNLSISDSTPKQRASDEACEAA